MEMEAPRRSALDRLRELSTKKPRLSEDSERERNSSAGINSDRSRPYAQARSAVGGNGSNPRFRASEREDREEVGRGGVSYQQQQELVAQYRTALAELTFNSKPIITNLTIIAGENLHSAKAIAATVCENVLEVPSEQKLPSLYLLDSIVKNIGSDYIKYFAARLPHVFCKAYKQVDPSIHHSLWHLFRTWKGVFPPSCLQSIENELGFQNLLNGSSGGTGTRPDAQAQKAPHSIHVNPKYLEARQRLQQSAKGKEISNEDIGDEAAASVGGTERPNRTTSTGTTRQWSELSNKNAQLPQREQPSDFINERQGYKETRESRFSSSKISQQQDVGVGRFISRGKELDEVGRTANQINDSDEPNKPYFEASGAYRQNGLDTDHAYGGYSNKSSGTASNNSQLPSIHLNRTKWPLSKNWKTSEEEEYIWDDVRSRSTDYEGVGGNKSNWSAEDPEKPIGSQGRKWLSLAENEQAESRLNKAEAFQLRPKIPGTGDKIHFPRDYVEHYSQHNSQEIEPRASKSSWPLPLHDSSLPALGLDSNKTPLRDSGQTERRPTSFVSALSAKDSSGMPRTGFQSALPSSLGSSLDVQGSGGVLGHQRQLPIRSPSPTALPSVPPAPLQQQKLRGPIDQDYLPSLSSQIDQKSSEPVDHFNRDPFPLPVSSDNPSQNTSLNSQPYQFNRDLQAVRSEALASASQGFKGSELKGFPGLMHSNIPVDVSGQPSTNNLLAAILKSEILSKKPSNIHPPLPSGPPPTQALASTAPLPTSTAETMTPSPLIGGMLPPLPPGPPPSSTSAAGASSQAAGLNPLSSLLSSLVAKGLITSASAQLPTFTSSQVSKESSSQNSDPDRSTSTLLPPSLKELPTCDPLAESDNMIGLQFKTEVIREFHPSVIDSLRLGHHGSSDWHRSINSEINGVDRVCRRWYSQADNWVSDEVERSCGPAPTPPSEEPLEPMVAADESQCICAFCGEPFEDFYSVERDEWMYRGTVYLNSTDEKCVAGEMQNRMAEGPIVHAKCISALPRS